MRDIRDWAVEPRCVGWAVGSGQVGDGVQRRIDLVCGCKLGETEFR